MATLECVQAVAFDLDGTLCDSIADIAQAANAMREALGLTRLPQDVLESYVGDGIGVLVHRALTEDKDKQADLALWEKGFTLFVQYYAEHIADHTKAYPNTETGLVLLKTLGIPLAVVTNKHERLAVKLLQALGLFDHFSLVIGGDSLPEKKPSPLPLLHTAQVLGVEVKNMLMVGDSRNDVLAAKAAGCLSVGVTFGYGDMVQLSQEPATKPDWLIASLTEIYDHLRVQEEG